MTNGTFELTQSNGTITDSEQCITVTRRELQYEREWLLQRLQQLHRLLGLPSIQTSSKQKRDRRMQDN